MKRTASIVALLCGALVTALPAEEKIKKEIPNRLIDFVSFSKDMEAAGKLRAERRITEEDFIAMAKEENTIILDTRSAAKFAMLHVKGAVHLNFSDFTDETLKKAIPSKQTRILIYCNNNFEKAPKAFPSKIAKAALNIPTFITLYSYGYKNIYELGPLLDVKKTKIELVGMQFAQTSK